MKNKVSKVQGWISFLLLSSLLLHTMPTGAAERDLPVVKVHFVVLTDNIDQSAAGIDRAMHNEIDILNKYFVKRNGDKIIKFELNDVVQYDEIRSSNCEFIRIGEFAGEYNASDWQKRFNKCKDKKVIAPNTINFYIYDSYSENHGFSNKNSHGKNNHRHPYILLDWERLNHQDQSPEEHEMGHALGLEHVCVPGAGHNSDTNIMASADCGEGSGGLRNLGFEDDQVKKILDSYAYPLKK